MIFPHSQKSYIHIKEKYYQLITARKKLRRYRILLCTLLNIWGFLCTKNTTGSPKLYYENTNSLLLTLVNPGKASRS